jgi:hypothetical protein
MDHGHRARMDHGRGSVLVDGGEHRGRRVVDPRRDNDGHVRVDGGSAEPCTKILWTSTIASYVVVEIYNHNSKMMQEILIIYKRSFEINIDFNFNTIVWGIFFSNPLHVVFIRLGARGYFFMMEHS